MISTALTTFTFSMYLFVNDISFNLNGSLEYSPAVLAITSFIQLLQGVMLLKVAFHEALTLSPRLLMENGLYLVNLFSLYPLESIFDSKSKSAKTIIIFTIFILLRTRISSAKSPTRGVFVARRTMFTYKRTASCM